MAQQPHDKSGRSCAGCGKPFAKSSLNFSIPVKSGNLIINNAVCGKCYNTHYEKGE